MALLVIDCPHCGAEEMTFIVHGGKASRFHGELPVANIFADCSRCSRPIAAELLSTTPGVMQGNMASLLGSALQMPIELQSNNWRLLAMWPEGTRSEVPDHLPDPVRRAFAQGEANFRATDCEEAAATMYRRSLDVGLKLAFPDQKGDLHRRIEALVAVGVLPASLGEWAHQVRLIGNDGAHDLEGVTRADLKTCRDFVDAMLRYTFSFPQMVAERRALSEAAPVSEPKLG